MVKHKLTVGSLFAGIGGFELGFESTGRFETLWQVERDKYASQVLAKHWPDVHRHDDVCTWPNETAKPVDVLLAGFPCQDISYAGKGAGLNGERSGLFFEVMRIVREMEPRYVVLENVSALLTRGMGDVLGSISSLGFNAEWEIVSALSVGAPHRRDRVFIIGWNTDGEHVKAVGGVQKRQVADSSGSGDVSDAEHDGPHRNRKDEQKRKREKMGRDKFIGRHGSNGDLADSNSERGRSRNTQRQNAENARQSSRRAQHWGWNSEPAVGRVANGVSRRVDRLKCLGNAIVPQVAQVVAERLLDIHEANA